MSAFIFNNQAKIEAAHRAELPRGIKSKAALLDALSVDLRFPAYFSGNWDAFDECICDLSWLPPGDVVLSHKDLPLSGDRASLSTYLSILQDAIENWNTKGSNLIFASPERWATTGKCESLVKRKFFVMFPSDAQRTVESALAEGQGSRGSPDGGQS